jgi:hypothetical protein
LAAFRLRTRLYLVGNLDRKFTWLGAFQDAIHIFRGALERVD